MQKKHAVIIGAGPAGLTAAHELLTRAAGEWDVTVLEASDAMGGIARTVEHNGNRMDLGGHRFFSRDERVNEWWVQRMPMQGSKAFDDLALGRECPVEEDGPDPESDDCVMLSRRRVSRIYFDHKFFDYPVSLKPSTLKAMGPVTTMSVGASFVSGRIRQFPETNLENFYINRFGRKLYSMFFEGYTEKLWGRHPRDISAEWGAQRVKGLSVGAVLKDAVASATGRRNERQSETSLIGRFSYPKLGCGQLWEIVADEVRDMGGKILTHAEVAEIDVSAGNRVSIVRCADGRAFACDALFSSMPLRDFVASMPDVPTEISRIASGLPYRDFVTVGMLVPKLARSNETDYSTLANIVPDNWIYVQDARVRLGRIQVFNNWSPYLVADPLRSVWLGLEYFCSEGDACWEMGDEARVAESVRELVAMGLLEPGAKVFDYHIERVRKAYPAYFDTYDRMDELQGWLDLHPNLYCIGRNGQHRYNNMDHSMMTAFEAVDCLLVGSTDHSRVWNVNTEGKYHEEK